MMKALLHRSTPQPLTAVLLSGVACLTLLVMWLDRAHRGTIVVDLSVVLLTLGLCGAVVVADRYPIHVNYHTKATVSTAVLFLVAVLLPPPLAILVGGVAKLISELSQPAKGNYRSDIVTCAARWVIVVFVGTSIAHLPVAADAQAALALVAAALVMFLGDMMTSGLELGPIASAPPHRLMLETTRSAWHIEGVLYSLAIFAAMAAAVHPWSLLLLVGPMVTVYIAFKRTQELQGTTRRLLENMADAVDLRDPYTGGHSRRVTEYTARILKELGLEGPDVDLIVASARVHDIGKIAVPDAVLHKPDKLTPEEWAIMESHSTLR